MSEEKLVKKILRSIPRKFDMKVATIEEVQDLSSMKVDKLIGSLQAFEISIRDKFEKKNKSITFISNTEEDEDQGERLSYAITLIGRNFIKYLRRLDKQWGKMSKKKGQTSVPMARENIKTDPVKEKGFNFMSVKDLVTSNMNALPF